MTRAVPEKHIINFFWPYVLLLNFIFFGGRCNKNKLKFKYFIIDIIYNNIQYIQYFIFHK